MNEYGYEYVNGGLVEPAATKSEKDAGTYPGIDCCMNNPIKDSGLVCTRPKGHKGKCAIGCSNGEVIRIRKIKPDLSIPLGARDPITKAEKAIYKLYTNNYSEWAETYCGKDNHNGCSRLAGHKGVHIATSGGRPTRRWKDEDSK